MNEARRAGYCEIDGCGLQWQALCSRNRIAFVCEDHARQCGCSECRQTYPVPKKGGGFETEWKKKPFCPKCGAEVLPREEFSPEFGAPYHSGMESVVVPCEECDAKIVVEFIVSVHFSTELR